VTRTIDIAELIDSQKIGAFQLRVFLLCTAVLFVDGFDVQAITYVAPALSREWGLARGALGPTFSAGLFGVMLGALLIAPLADRLGRRLIIVYSCVAFGIGTLLTVFVDSLSTLLMLRLVTGLGLGAAIPNAIALASEYAPKRRRSMVVMFVGSGISLGAIAAGQAAAQLIGPFGWRAVFVAGGALPLVLAASLAFALPESLRFAAVVARHRELAKRLVRLLDPKLAGNDLAIRSPDVEGGRTTVADLFRSGRGVATVLLWIAFFMSLLNVYLAINWLPTSLNASGFSVADAATITSLYHVGGVAGTYALGLLMDRLGPYRMLLGALLLAAIGLYVFATVTDLDRAAVTGVLMLAGLGVVGGQVGINALASMIYPVAMRSTGLGWALGIGRIGSIVGPTIGGIILATAENARSVYLVCIVPILIGMAAVALLRKQASRATERQAAASQLASH
jgi:AAHS family 4-hydroxybenzoate transporter-like MFS transporter